ELMHGNVRQLVVAPQKQAGGSPSLPRSEAKPLDLRAILGVLLRHKWIIIATVILIVGLTAFATTQLQRQYTATTLVVVDSRDSDLLGFRPGVGDSYSGTSTVDTEVEIAKSAKVLRRAAIALDLANSPDSERTPSTLDLIKSMFGLGSEPEPAPTGPRSFNDLSPDAQARILEGLNMSLDIGRVGITNVISISATTSSPESAARTANALADAYLTEQIESKLSSTERAVAFLQDRVSSLAREIATGEAELDRFVQDQIATLGSATAKNLLAQLEEESKRRETSGSTLTELQALLSKQDYVGLAALQDTSQSGLAKRREDLVAQLTRTSDAERIAEARRQLDALDSELRIGAERQVVTIQNQLATSSERSAALRDQIGATLADLELPQDVTVTLFQLQREVETRRVLYDSFLAKLQQVEQQTGFNIPDSRVIATAVPPVRPSFPPSRAIVAAALFLSICTGIGLALLREHFIGGITRTEQFENLGGIPVVAAVPRSSGELSKRPDLAIVNQPLSAYSEAIRRGLLGIIPVGAKGRRCIFVTSSVPGEGKTTLALSLARQAAMTGSPTLLIDADLRHPSVRGLLGDKSEGGLIDYLMQPPGGDSHEISIVKEPSSGVSFVLGGNASSGSTDTLLMSTRFDDLIRFAREEYETIIIDTPPVGLVVDATIIARHCDA
ncbi:MAG: hypothetical protein FJX57_19660, partial [Alphaproteobacteria bacterium]|nr:hypothetical protein [Alphaproteobacteria bacterium]